MDERIERGIELRRGGATWRAAAAAVGVSAYRLRVASDPAYAMHRRDGINARRRSEYWQKHYEPSKHIVDRHVSPDEASAALAAVPADMRSFTARAFGDPLPGRSALDRRNRVPVNAYAQEAASDSPTIHTSHTSSWRAG